MTANTNSCTGRQGFGKEGSLGTPFHDTSRNKSNTDRRHRIQMTTPAFLYTSDEVDVRCSLHNTSRCYKWENNNKIEFDVGMVTLRQPLEHERRPAHSNG